MDMDTFNGYESKTLKKKDESLKKGFLFYLVELIHFCLFHVKQVENKSELLIIKKWIFKLFNENQIAQTWTSLANTCRIFTNNGFCWWTDAQPRPTKTLGVYYIWLLFLSIIMNWVNCKYAIDLFMLLLLLLFSVHFVDFLLLLLSFLSLLFWHFETETTTNQSKYEIDGSPKYVNKFMNGILSHYLDCWQNGLHSIFFCNGFCVGWWGHYNLRHKRIMLLFIK